MHRSWIAAIAVVLCSCGMSPEEEACRDLVDAMASLAGKCGDDEDQTRETILDLYGDCEVTAIRDEDELRSECIPAIEATDCQTLKDDPTGWLPEPCRQQIML